MRVEGAAKSGEFLMRRGVEGREEITIGDLLGLAEQAK